MNTSKGIRIGGIIIIMLVALYMGSAFYSAFVYHEPEENMVNVYFFDPVSNRLVPEKHYLPPDSYSNMAKYLWGLLLIGPDNENLSGVFPDNISNDGVEKIRVVSPPEDRGYRNIELYFYEDYLNVAPAAEIIFRSAFVWTFTELDWVNEIIFKVNGAELTRLDGTGIGNMDRHNVLINTPITREKKVRKFVTLYFANQEMTGLVAERRVIEVPSNVSEERAVLQALFEGPSTEGLLSPIPMDTVINDVNKEAATCYVDLNPAFENRLLPGTPARKLAVYSIVNTLTELGGGELSKVQFWINAERIASKNLEVDLNQAFERDESFILIRTDDNED